MTKSLAFETRPRSWSIETGHDRDGRPAPELRIGSRRVLLDDVEGVDLETIAERDFKGLAVMGAMFSSGAILFLLLVTVFDWRTRFFIAVSFLGALALASFVEAWTANRITLHRLHIRLRSGDTAIFASADEAEIAGLLAAVQRDTSATDGTPVRDHPRRIAA